MNWTESDRKFTATDGDGNTYSVVPYSIINDKWKYRLYVNDGATGNATNRETCIKRAEELANKLGVPSTISFKDHHTPDIKALRAKYGTKAMEKTSYDVIVRHPNGKESLMGTYDSRNKADSVKIHLEEGDTMRIVTVVPRQE